MPTIDHPLADLTIHCHAHPDMPTVSVSVVSTADATVGWVNSSFILTAEQAHRLAADLRSAANSLDARARVVHPAGSNLVGQIADGGPL